MFARAIRPAVAVSRTQAVQQQQAGMATLKEIDQRLKSVKNIGKITKVGQAVVSDLARWVGWIARAGQRERVGG